MKPNLMPFLISVFAAVSVSCGGAAPNSGNIEMMIQVHAGSTDLTRSADISRVTVTVTPAGISTDLILNTSTSSFNGTLTVPTGAQTVKADAYAGITLVGTGSAPVTVVKGQTVLAAITILDNTGPGPVPDHSPVITSFVVPITAQAGDQLTASATAMDADGQTLVYAWSASPTGCATFSAASAASTSVTAVIVGTCTLQLVATSGGLTDSRSANLIISVATGTLTVTGTYVPQPQITQIELLDGTTVVWTVNRTSSDATLHTPLSPSHLYGVRARFDQQPEGTLQLSTACGGTLSQPSLTFPASIGSGSWTTPASSPACIVTVTLTRLGLTDAFPVVVVVGP